ARCRAAKWPTSPTGDPCIASSMQSLMWFFLSDRIITFHKFERAGLQVRLTFLPSKLSSIKVRVACVGWVMRRLSLALVVVICTIVVTQIASAQQPLRSPVYWTGFYAGGNLGYSWGRSSSTLLFADNTGTLAAGGPSFDLNGLIGGGQVGYNWRAGIWVFGLETDFQG